MKWPWQRTSSVSAFVSPPGSELGAEHAVVSRWVEEAVAALDERHSYQDVELKSQPSGRVMLDATPEVARRYVHAAAVQTAHWDRLANAIRSQGKSDLERANAHLRAGWNDVWVRRRRAATVVSTLMRRALPFEEGDLVAILDSCSGTERLSTYTVPVGHITRALQRFVAARPLSDSLRQHITRTSRDMGPPSSSSWPVPPALPILATALSLTRMSRLPRCHLLRRLRPGIPRSSTRSSASWIWQARTSPPRRSSRMNFSSARIRPSVASTPS
jgi:hypothetical protein